MVICLLSGHKWLYKDYSNIIGMENKRFDYKKSRRCIRCNKREVQTFDDKWIKGFTPPIYSY